MSQTESSPSASADRTSFLSLLEVHGRLDWLFLRHQEAVLLLDVDLSRSTLDDFERELVEHIRFEEVDLFPIYERALPIAGGGLDLYLKEHEKLLRYVRGIRLSFESLSPRESGGPARVIELLDFEAKFKNLLKHHDLRERNILYPTLDSVASPEEKSRLLLSATEGQ